MFWFYFLFFTTQFAGQSFKLFSRPIVWEIFLDYIFKNFFSLLPMVSLFFWTSITQTSRNSSNDPFISLFFITTFGRYIWNIFLTLFSKSSTEFLISAITFYYPRVFFLKQSILFNRHIFSRIFLRILKDSVMFFCFLHPILSLFSKSGDSWVPY